MAIDTIYYDDDKACWDRETIDSHPSEPAPSVDSDDHVSTYTESSAFIQDSPPPNRVGLSQAYYPIHL